MRKFSIACVTLLLSTLPGLAAPATPAKAKNGEPVLQAMDGRSLYVFDEDKPGQSTCTGECLKLWPPFLKADGDVVGGDWTTTARPDGSAQWMYKGRPLYLFARDTQAGQANGASFNGNKWHLAKP